MKEEQRQLFAKGMVDLANIVAGAMVFGQFISEKAVNIDTIILGILFCGVFYVGAFSFSKERIPHNP